MASRADRSDQLQGLGVVLDEILHRRPWRAGVGLGRLVLRWPQVVGERLAQECAPARLDEGVLTVWSSSAAWGAQISFLSGQVRSRANEVLGDDVVVQVRVVVDPRSEEG